MIGSADLPTLAKAKPNKSEMVMMPRIFMSTAATAMLSGKILLKTRSNASRAEMLSCETSGACMRVANKFQVSD